MKTPEEIKKGLGIYLTNDEIDCESPCLDDEYVCPYKEVSMLTGKSCGELILEDTISLISQLEADVRIADIKREAMFAKAEQLEKERDALLEVLKNQRICTECIHYEEKAFLNEHYDAPSQCINCIVADVSQFRWKGLREE
jgi:hypothetical protein